MVQDAAHFDRTGSMRFELASSLDILRRTPSTLRALLDGADDAWTRSNEGSDTFSPFDVVGHLIDGEETDWMPRARIILSRDPAATFAPYDRFRHYERNRGRSLASLLDEFGRLRAANLESLAVWNLGDAELDLRAMHPSLGPVTLRQLLATWVAHDLGHVAQVARVMAKQYRDQVGPWVEYLPVLTDHESPRS
jgi:DinB superfamily